MDNVPRYMFTYSGDGMVTIHDTFTNTWDSITIRRLQKLYGPNKILKKCISTDNYNLVGYQYYADLRRRKHSKIEKGSTIQLNAENKTVHITFPTGQTKEQDIVGFVFEYIIPFMKGVGDTQIIRDNPLGLSTSTATELIEIAITEQRKVTYSHRDAR